MADANEAIENERDSTHDDNETPPSLSVTWRHISRENLSLQYAVIYGRSEADRLLQRCEEDITDYNTGRLAQVQVFGKWHDIPRKQVAFGDSGLSYKFSGNTVPAREWTPLILSIRDKVEKVSGCKFNFVLVNRYQDGNDHMGEHRDDESDLVRTAPIASLSLGQPRAFIFKHADSRGKNAKRKIPVVSMTLDHGSLLLMNYPTNIYWYHSLPKRKRLPGVRINFTFRVMKR